MSGGHGHGDEPTPPGAGNELVWTVPNGQFFMLQSLVFRLVTASTSGTRTVGIKYRSASFDWFTIYGDQTQSNSATVDYCFSDASLNNFETGPDHTSCPMSEMILDDSFTIETTINNMKSGDVLSAIGVYGQYWMDPQ